MSRHRWKLVATWNRPGERKHVAVSFQHKTAKMSMI